MHPFPLLYFQRQYFNRIYDHKSLSLLKSICNMTQWISLSGPRDIAWVVLYSRIVAPATQCVQICWDSITHPCIILGRCYQYVCHCYQKNITNYPIKSVPIFIMIMFGIFFIFIVQLISNEIIIKPWTFNNTSGLQIFIGHCSLPSIQFFSTGYSAHYMYKFMTNHLHHFTIH